MTRVQGLVDRPAVRGRHSSRRRFHDRRDRERSSLSDLQARLARIEALATEFSCAVTEDPANEDEFPRLPPDHWINDRLAQAGASWRVQTIDGYRYEIYDLVL